MYAVIETCGKQYRVTAGDKIRFESLHAEEGASVTFDKVILLGKDDKVIVFKYRRKKNYRKFRGHRQQFTSVVIEEING